MKKRILLLFVIVAIGISANAQNWSFSGEINKATRKIGIATFPIKGHQSGTLLISNNYLIVSSGSEVLKIRLVESNPPGSYFKYTGVVEKAAFSDKKGEKVTVYVTIKDSNKKGTKGDALIRTIREIENKEDTFSSDFELTFYVKFKYKKN